MLSFTMTIWCVCAVVMIDYSGFVFYIEQAITFLKIYMFHSSWMN